MKSIITIILFGGSLLISIAGHAAGVLVVQPIVEATPAKALNINGPKQYSLPRMTGDKTKQALRPVFRKSDDEYWAEQERKRQEWLTVLDQSSFNQLIDENVERCESRIESVEKDLRYFADQVESEVCDESPGWNSDGSWDGTEHQTLSYLMKKVRNAKNSYQSPHGRLEKCINRFKREDALNIEEFNDSVERGYRKCGENGTFVFDQMIVDMNDVIDYRAEKIEAAERSIAAAENRRYDERQAEERAHQRRMNESFRNWVSDIQGSTNNTINQLSEVSDRTNDAYQSMRENFSQEFNRKKALRKRNAEATQDRMKQDLVQGNRAGRKETLGQESNEAYKKKNINSVFRQRPDNLSEDPFCKAKCDLNNCGRKGCEGCGFYGCRGIYGNATIFKGAKCGPDNTVIEAALDGGPELGKVCQ